jgi:tRNA G10  N-methylase Trm11
MEWAMANVPPGALVVDPFMGSGSTLIVAQRRGLRAIGIDVDERQCEIAAKRLSQGILAGLAIEDLEASAVEKVPDVGAGVQLQILD